jgi:very-short-patch-repair endonuclease
MVSEEFILQRIAVWKSRLIDTSKRNRLLFFKRSKRGSVRLIEPSAAAIYERLVQKAKSWQFYAEEPETDENEQDEVENASTHISRPRLATEPLTDKSPKELWRTLYLLRQRGREAVTEKGVVALHVAFGFLEWYESDTSSLRIESPLILVPVELIHTASHAPFRLQLVEQDSVVNEDVVVNPTLVHKLKADFGIDLPELPATENLNLSEYLDCVKQAVHAHKKWSVKDDVYLSLFSFLKINMFKDLEKHVNFAVSHPIIRRIIGDELSATDEAIEAPSADDLDRIMQPASTFEILEADSSQQEAIQAAKAGLTFVLEGPPGTGKSQTITNIISECLSANKKVLFVSEKMAALEVVYKRLKENGLADFCLEAHSYKVNKKTIIDELGRTLQAAKQKKPSVESELYELSRLKVELNSYAMSLHTARTKLNKTVFEVHGYAAQVAYAPDLLFTIPHIENYTYADLSGIDRIIAQIHDLHHVVHLYQSSYWRHISLEEFRYELRQDISRNLAELIQVIDDLSNEGNKLASACGAQPINNVKELLRVMEIASLLEKAEPIRIEWLQDRKIDTLIGSARAHQAKLDWYNSAKDSILHTYSPSFLTTCRPGLARELDDCANTILSHEFSGAGNIEELTGNYLSLISSFTNAIALLENASRVRIALLATSNVPAENTLTAIERLCSVLKLAASKIDPTDEWLDKNSLPTIGHKLNEAKRQASKYQSQTNTIMGVYLEEALGLDHQELLTRFVGEHSSIWRVFSKRYKSDIAKIQVTRRGTNKLRYKQAIIELQQLLELRNSLAWMEISSDELRSYLGPRFRGYDTDWETSIDALERFESLLELFQDRIIPDLLAEIMMSRGSGLDALGRSVAALDNDRASLNEIMRLLVSTGCIVIADGQAQDWTTTDLNDLLQWMTGALQQLETFRTLYQSVSSQVNSSAVPLFKDLVLALKKAERIHELELEVASSHSDLKHQFGELYTGIHTDWDTVNIALIWAGDVIEWLGSAPIGEAMIDACRDIEIRRPRISTLHFVTRNLTEKFRTLLLYFESQFTKSPFPFKTDMSAFSSVSAVVLGCQAELDTIVDILHFRSMTAKMRDLGLTGLVDAILVVQPAKDHIHAAFYKRFWNCWLDLAYSEDDSLKTFRGDHHTSIVERFRFLDKLQLRQARLRLASILSEQRPGSSWSSATSAESRILQNEVNKQRRHKAIRQLFKEVPFLLQTIKPCLLMSPLSVAQFLDPSKLSFDVVIFDEASQICPEDAVGSIMRGAQLIVVGDTKQLPPTTFFAASEAETFDDDSESDDAVADILFDSILDECISAGFRRKMLNWHYRSRNESLIAFSNKHFYKNELITFPSPEYDGNSTTSSSVDFVYVPHGTYVRGSVTAAGTNQTEAKILAEMVVNHFKSTPTLTLGVIAFSQKQQNAIDEQLRVLRRKVPHLDPLFMEDRPEPFFIKNLENVQGDERDVIFFSVGYGKDAAGKMQMNFGPLNKNGGQRRLNVAITRAKQKVRLVSSIQPEDIDTSKTQAEGVLRLKQYIQFARDGIAALARETSQALYGEAESLFESEVAAAIEQAGLRVHKQVGCSGYRIDLAIVDPNKPGRYLIGVECDGATYHSSKTARDRDRLRQQVLEGLGWTIIRIWSTDWIKQPKLQLERILGTVHEIQNDQSDEYSATKNGAVPTLTEINDGTDAADYDLYSSDDVNQYERLEGNLTGSDDVHSTLSSRVTDYTPYIVPLRGPASRFYEIAKWSPGILVDILSNIVKVEGPVHIDVATRRLVSGWGMGKAGSKLVSCTKAVAQRAVRDGLFEIRGDFLWPNVVPTAIVRTAGGRAIDEISLEELSAGAIVVIKDAYGMSRPDLVRQLSRLIGYERTGPLISNRIELAIDLAAQNNGIRIDGDTCWPASR